MTDIDQDVPIACQLLAPESRAREEAIQREIVGGIAEVRELPDGYALRFPGEAAWLNTLADFIRFERECCPFFRFELHAEQQHGPLWLHLRGPAGTKAFAAALLARTATSSAP